MAVKTIDFKALATGPVARTFYKRIHSTVCRCVSDDELSMMGYMQFWCNEGRAAGA
jgi:hypothetical protein